MQKLRRAQQSYIHPAKKNSGRKEKELRQAQTKPKVPGRNRIILHVEGERNQVERKTIQDKRRRNQKLAGRSNHLLLHVEGERRL